MPSERALDRRYIETTILLASTVHKSVDESYRCFGTILNILRPVSSWYMHECYRCPFVPRKEKIVGVVEEG